MSAAIRVRKTDKDVSRPYGGSRIDKSLFRLHARWQPGFGQNLAVHIGDKIFSNKYMSITDL